MKIADDNFPGELECEWVNLFFITNCCHVLLFIVAVKIMNSQLLSIFNCLITVVCAFVFGYKGLEYVVDDPTFGLVSIMA